MNENFVKEMFGEDPQSPPFMTGEAYTDMDVEFAAHKIAEATEAYLACLVMPYLSAEQFEDMSEIEEISPYQGFFDEETDVFSF